ncbi:hypothetical protein B0T16DRAFT_26347 [Cercophora newfieldiana]|uniref:Uncharacterized protein n=1 Tax=Cercophora newfieldiana TaxID=92897 RepID=A0AA40CY93_9PEZI|nr:hypothetical protein B0T16DRAFT_26347 [Cercophora newfieldiana]
MSQHEEACECVVGSKECTRRPCWATRGRKACKSPRRRPPKASNTGSQHASSGRTERGKPSRQGQMDSVEPLGRLVIDHRDVRAPSPLSSYPRLEHACFGVVTLAFAHPTPAKKRSGWLAANPKAQTDTAATSGQERKEREGKKKKGQRNKKKLLLLESVMSEHRWPSTPQLFISLRGKPRTKLGGTNYNCEAFIFFR